MTLRLILGDQLGMGISSLNEASKENDLILLCEVKTEATYVKHHKKKIAFVFSSMRHFADELRAQGFDVRYSSYDDPQNSGSFLGELKRALAETNKTDVVVTEASEYRLRDDMSRWGEQLNATVTVLDDSRFLCTHSAFNDWAEGRKQLRMEYFYREMRRKYSVLMNDAQPVGGQWNFDAENRKPPKEGLNVPSTYHTTPDAITTEVIALVYQLWPT